MLSGSRGYMGADSRPWGGMSRGRSSTLGPRSPFGVFPRKSAARVTRCEVPARLLRMHRTPRGLGSVAWTERGPGSGRPFRSSGRRCCRPTTRSAAAGGSAQGLRRPQGSTPSGRRTSDAPRSISTPHACTGIRTERLWRCRHASSRSSSSGSSALAHETVRAGKRFGPVVPVSGCTVAADAARSRGMT